MIFKTTAIGDWTTLNRFGTAEQPFLPIIPSGQREIVTLARVVLASKIPYREIFKHDAKAYAMPQEALHVWELPVSHMPGPQEQANRYYLWGYGTTAEGLVGILTLGRVLRSSIEAARHCRGQSRILSRFQPVQGQRVSP